jgi:two-component system, chemotaxis family, chemotaxis protein CheY
MRPLIAARQPGINQHARQRGVATQERMMGHCLVVDDSDIIRKVARHILEEVNVTSTEAENGPEALERCKTAMPDIILLDWQMPAMSAVDFLTLLRRQPRGDQPVVIYCTTENDASDIAKAIEAGANDYILKPFDRESIGAKLVQLGLIVHHASSTYADAEY